MPKHRLVTLRPWQRHSQVLAVAGAVYVTYGVVALLIAGPPSTNARALADLLPQWFWGIIWVLVGGLALVSTRWPPSSKTWGYTALAGLAALWSAVYLTSPLLGAEWGRNVGGVLVWGLVAYLWFAVAGLVNPDDLPAPEPEPEG